MITMATLTQKVVDHFENKVKNVEIKALCKMPRINELVELYFRIKDMSSLLAHTHGVVMSVRVLKQWCRKLCVCVQKEKHTNLEELFRCGQDEMVGNGQMQGYQWSHLVQ